MKPKTLLITGIHRSGSTWMGKIMGMSKELQYIHEPFNIAKNSDMPLQYWYQYFTLDSDVSVRKKLKKYLNKFHQIDFIRLFKALKKTKYLGQAKDAFLYEFKCFHAIPLYKDPIALLLSEWFYEELDAYVIVSIRHPAAFVASVKVKNWIFDFNNLLKQDQLMQDYLLDYKLEMELANEKQDLIESSILIWNILYSVVFKLQEKYKDNPNWIFIRHEDLSRSPEEKYNQIFKKLNLKFTTPIKNAIINSSKPQEGSYLSRDSKENIFTWKKRLEPEEIEIIKSGTKEVWKHFYIKEDW
ncbi:MULTISPECIES: sulfotransferase [Winogradskyella]|uniref:sulfotransferase n=1 Tax=Winogradskyella TaxID=286104 RepID=UPI0015CEDE82|nr:MULTISPECIES: sulfotransferase [Winogradskyella]QXP78211.1 sulfotransferase [Winogradskyella sp. HaHa_3_26]